MFAERFMGTYRIPSNRMSGYEYTKGKFFVTICTRDRYHFFGEIIDKTMVVNDMGQIVYHEIQNIPNHRNGVQIDAFVIMPNHIHMIIIINDGLLGGGETPHGDDICAYGTQYHNNGRNNGRHRRDVLSKRLYPTNTSPTNTSPTNTSPTNESPNKPTGTRNKSQYYSQISPNTWSLGNVIKLFKWYVTKQIWALGKKSFSRQANYHDSIISNEESLRAIRKYIKDNPRKRQRDRNNIISNDIFQKTLQ